MNDNKHASTETGPMLANIEMWIKPTEIEAYYTYLQEILPGTKGFEGCQKIEIFTDPDDQTHLLFQATWDNLAQQLKYVAWREETGVSAQLGSFLIKPIALSNWQIAKI